MRTSTHRLQILAGWTAVSAALMTACGGGGGGPAIQARPQSIVFAAAPALILGGSATVSATASSALATRYSSLSPAVCSVHASTGLVTALAVGTCVIAADQDGNDTFAPAAQATQALPVVFDPAQTITFGAAPTLKLFGAATVSARASSGLPVTYSSLTTSVCTVDASSGAVTSITEGTCVIAADQAGNANYQAAPRVTQSLTIEAWPGGVPMAPGAPTGVSATLGRTANTVLVSFTGPEFSGGSQVTHYTVASTAGGLIATGSASPIMVTCPSACLGYAFTVTASNSAGAGQASTAADVLTDFDVTARWFEPDTQPNDTVFTGSFTLNSTQQTVTGLTGSLTESMTGPPMLTVPLRHQLSTVPDGLGGLKVTTFALNTANVFSEGGFSSNSAGLYFGYPNAINPSAGGVGNAFATIYINLADPMAALTSAQINQLAYGDCFAGGMMGDTCMTGYAGIGTMGGYPVAQHITRK